MANLILLIEYDGSNYSGWQTQENSKTVQDRLEQAIEVLCQRHFDVVGSGRTDTGVHAFGQVASIENFETTVPMAKLADAINRYLPFDIRVRKVYSTELQFSARFDAVQREYIYNLNLDASVFKRHFSGLVRYNLNVEEMIKSAEIFVGEYDFTTFSKLNLSTQSYICDVLFSEWRKIDENNYQFKVVANRFVYGMVRSLVGVMIDIGRGKRSIEQTKEALLAKDRTFISPLAPANGLILNKVYYKDEFSFLNQ